MTRARGKTEADLCEALAHLDRGDQYKSHLSRLVRECVERLIAGDPEAPRDVLKALDRPLHAAERLPATFQGLEAATWVRAAAQFLETSAEVAQFHPLLKHKVKPLDRSVLAVLRDAGPDGTSPGLGTKPMKRAEIWRQVGATSHTEAEVGQALTRCTERHWVVRFVLHGPEGSCYRISNQGLALLDATGN